MRPVESAEITDALRSALTGGEPVLPLPDDPVERDRLLRAVASIDVPPAEDTAAVVATSGSTGEPKAAMLSRAAIRAAVAATHDRLGGSGEWVSALPGHYVAGLMVQARAIVAGTRLVAVRRDLADLPTAVLDSGPRRYLSLVPTQLHRGLTEPTIAEALAGFDAVLLGGGPAAPELLAAAADHGIRVVTTYGMSETCGGCVYDGVPLSGTTISLDADDRIVIESDAAFSGYWGDPARTAAVLRDGRLLTADRGRWREDRLEVLGRLDDLVITGGHKVDLVEIEAELNRWLAARDGSGVALAVPDADLGMMIVAAADRPIDLHTLRDGLTGRLSRAALPRRVITASPLPRLSSGKPDRERLRALVLAEAVR